MDLLGILQEFESYYAFKFGKQPKFVRKNTSGDIPKSTSSASKHPTPYTLYSNIHNNSDTLTSSQDGVAKYVPLPMISRSNSFASVSIPHSTTTSKQNPSSTGGKQRPTSSHSKRNLAGNQSNLDSSVSDLGIQAVGTKVSSASTTHTTLQPLATSTTLPHDETPVDLYETKLLRPFPDYGNSELKDLAATITRDIFLNNPNVKWDDIAGLESSKRLIKEAIVYPIKYPKLTPHSLLFYLNKKSTSIVVY